MAYSYSVGFIVLVFASIFVVAEDVPDPCKNEGLQKNCTLCVSQKVSADKTKTCIFLSTPVGLICQQNRTISEGANLAATTDDCDEMSNAQPGDTTLAPPPSNTTTTTVAPPTTSSSTTSTPPPTTNGTSTTTTAAPTTNGTSTTSQPPTTNGTSTTLPPITTLSPNTTTPTPTPAPKSGGWSAWSFFGGIVFALALSALGYIIWRFYKARLDRNYHTLASSLI